MNITLHMSYIITNLHKSNYYVNISKFTEDIKEKELE